MTKAHGMTRLIASTRRLIRDSNGRSTSSLSPSSLIINANLWLLHATLVFPLPLSLPSTLSLFHSLPYNKTLIYLSIPSAPPSPYISFNLSLPPTLAPTLSRSYLFAFSRSFTLIDKLLACINPYPSITSPSFNARRMLSSARTTRRLRDFLNEQHLYYIFFLFVSLLPLVFPSTSSKIPLLRWTRRSLLMPTSLAAPRALSYRSRSNFVNDRSIFFPSLPLANGNPSHSLLPSMRPLSPSERRARVQKSLGSYRYSGSAVNTVPI